MRVSPLREWLALVGILMAITLGAFLVLRLPSGALRFAGVASVFVAGLIAMHAFTRKHLQPPSKPL